MIRAQHRHSTGTASCSGRPFLLARIWRIYENVAQKQTQHRHIRELITVISILHYSCYRRMGRWCCVQTPLSCSSFFVGFCNSCSKHGQTMHMLLFGGCVQHVSCRTVWLCDFGEGHVPGNPLVATVYHRSASLGRSRRSIPSSICCLVCGWSTAASF
jgi:hypothetical protein